MVVGVVAYLLQVVMLAADAQTLLSVGTTARFGVASTQNYILPLVHAGIGEHQCGVVLHHHGGRRNDEVTLGLEVLLVRVADFISCHHIACVV